MIVEVNIAPVSRVVVTSAPGMIYSDLFIFIYDLLVNYNHYSTKEFYSNIIHLKLKGVRLIFSSIETHLNQIIC